jgi:AcrR family transcriptional regulator
MPRKPKYDNLREACIEEAMRIIETDGIEKLSMREVARRLGVSHQAPYKHFESRDHIHAEILRRSFDDFARHLDARPKSDNPYADMAVMGQAYIQYAAENPLQYRLMFGTPMPDPAQHPDMMARAQHAFGLLRTGIARMGHPASDTEMDALFVWATVHGLAGILQMEMYNGLMHGDHSLEETMLNVIARIGTGVGGNEPS